MEVSKSHKGSKNRKQTDADGDWYRVPGVREMTEIKQQDHYDVFYHKQYVGDQLNSSEMFSFTFFSVSLSVIIIDKSSRNQ